MKFLVISLVSSRQERSLTIAAAVFFLSYLLLHVVSGFTSLCAPRPRATISTLKASNAVEGGRYNYNDNNKNRRHKKRYQLRQKHSQNSQLVDNTAREQDLIYGEDEVHEWLLRSTSQILGEDTTLRLISGEADTDTISSDDINQKLLLPLHFSTNEEFILNSESVMRAWCQWISHCSSSGNSVNFISDDDCVLRCTTINAAKIVDTILHQVIGLIDVDKDDIDKGRLVELISCGIDAWANTKSRDGESIACAEGWLKFLKQRFPLPESLRDCYSCDDTLKLYEECYRGVIKAYIRSHERRYLEKALGVLKDIKEEHIQLEDCEGSRLYPATQTYNLVLYGLANCQPCLSNAQQAEKLLEEMIACNRNECSPDSNTFRQVISAWTKTSGSVEAAENANRVLEKMLADFPLISPDASSFNALMTLYLKLGMIEETLALFDQMSSMFQSGQSNTKPDTYSFNLMLEARTKQPPSKTLEDMESVEQLLGSIGNQYHVDVYSYNLILDAYAKSYLKEAAARAESLLHLMESKGRQDPSVAPDAYSFTSAINAIGRSRHHKERGTWAQKIFNQMKDLHSQGLVEKPSTPVYNALLDALISSEESGSTRRAEALFDEMQSKMLANTRSYNTMMKLYSKFGRNRQDGKIISPSQPRKAEQLLNDMEFSYHNKGKASSIIPDKYSYTTVISAYGRSNVKRKAAKALNVLHRMIDAYLEGNTNAKPGTFAFNAVLNACAHTRALEERLEGFTILCSTLILQRDWAQPDHTTYGIFLQACSRLLPRDEARKWRVVEAVFNSCIKDGQCGDLVLKSLEGLELYEALVGRFLTDDGLDIPVQWRRNVDRTMTRYIHTM